MLAVDLDPALGPLLDHPRRRHPTVQVAAVRAVAVDLASDQGLLPVDLEQTLDHGPLRALAYGVPRSARAEEERQRVDEDRLAGSRLSGQDVQTRPQIDLGGVDQRVFLDVQASQHVRPSVIGSCSAPWPRGRPT